MKNCILSAASTFVQKVREQVSKAMVMVGEVFQQWLGGFAGEGNGSTHYPHLVKLLTYVRPGRHFSRQELNER